MLSLHVHVHVIEYEICVGLEGVICLNIRSFGGGADFWGKSAEHKPFVTPSHSDRLLEVIGVRSSFHMGQIQVGLTDPVRLCQGTYHVNPFTSHSYLLTYRPTDDYYVYRSRFVYSNKACNAMSSRW
jgi:hypothetical protein